MTLLGVREGQWHCRLAPSTLVCSLPPSTAASDLSADSGHALFITAGHRGLVFSARLMSAAEILQRISIIKSLFIKKQVILGAGNSQ